MSLNDGLAERFAGLCETRGDSLLGCWRQGVKNQSGRLPTFRFGRLMEVVCASLRQSSLPVECFSGEFEIVEVANLGVLRNCMVELAEIEGLTLSPALHRTLNHIFDNLTGEALRAHSRQSLEQIKVRRHEHLACLAHEFRTPLTAAVMAAHLLDAAILEECKVGDYALLMDTLRSNLGGLKALIAQAVESDTVDRL